MKRKDINQLAKNVLDRAVRDNWNSYVTQDSKAAKSGRLGGLKGGVTRAKKLSPEQRRQIAVNAAKARWGK